MPVSVEDISEIVEIFLRMVRNHIMAHVENTGKQIWCKFGANNAVTNMAAAPRTDIRLAG